MSTPNTPVVQLYCCTCGLGTWGRQWHDRDTGYGLCTPCGAELSPEEARDLGGERGIHWDVPKPPPTPVPFTS